MLRPTTNGPHRDWGTRSGLPSGGDQKAARSYDLTTPRTILAMAYLRWDCLKVVASAMVRPPMAHGEPSFAVETHGEPFWRGALDPQTEAEHDGGQYEAGTATMPPRRSCDALASAPRPSWGRNLSRRALSSTSRSSFLAARSASIAVWKAYPDDPTVVCEAGGSGVNARDSRSATSTPATRSAISWVRPARQIRHDPSQRRHFSFARTRGSREPGEDGTTDPHAATRAVRSRANLLDVTCESLCTPPDESIPEERNRRLRNRRIDYLQSRTAGASRVACEGVSVAVTSRSCVNSDCHRGPSWYRTLRNGGGTHTTRNLKRNRTAPRRRVTCRAEGSRCCLRAQPSRSAARQATRVCCVD